MRQTVFDYIKKEYKVLPDYPWEQHDGSAVFRHSDSRKWFALVMSVQKSKLGLPYADYVDAINLKVDDMFFRDMIIQKEGIMPAYHMNKQHWITVLLDGTVEADTVYNLIDMSFAATAPAPLRKKGKTRPKKEGSRK